VRLERLNELQRLITAERYERRLGQTVRALVDRVDAESVQARIACQADDIDGVTYVTGAAGITPGAFIDVRLDEVVDDVDFAATFVRVVSAPTAPPRQARSLPVVSSIGSYGR
jgi:2-methylthioadenine synthetase